MSLKSPKKKIVVADRFLRVHLVSIVMLFECLMVFFCCIRMKCLYLKTCVCFAAVVDDRLAIIEKSFNAREMYACPRITLHLLIGPKNKYRQDSEISRCLWLVVAGVAAVEGMLFFFSSSESSMSDKQFVDSKKKKN